jgi:hypothetical protein
MTLIVRLDEQARQDLNWLTSDGGFGDENEAVSTAVCLLKTQVARRRCYVEADSCSSDKPFTVDSDDRQLALRNAQCLSPELASQFLSRRIPNF